MSLDTPSHRPARLPVSHTVYSVVWPATEVLIRRCLTEEIDALMARHRQSFTQTQDALHEPFMDAWRDFAGPAVRGLATFDEAYPCSGSSEAIREIIRQASWKQQALVIFDGDYEGYEAIARMQNTSVIRVDRADWRQTMDRWQTHGVPWGAGGAQWWVSQPSAIDGNDWLDFADWLAATDTLPGCDVWIDLTYLGRARLQQTIDLRHRPAVAGVVFSLSKVMGAYYRRIGGCLSRMAVPGLWANRWFKNLDSLFLGQRWLEGAGDAISEGQRYAQEQNQAMAIALESLGGESAWCDAGTVWRPSDVPLLMYAAPVRDAAPGFQPLFDKARRGQHGMAGARLCLTPTLEAMISGSSHRVA